MKRLLLLILLLLACGEPRTANRGPRMKVGLLTPGSVNDNGWNAIAYEGLQRIHQELGGRGDLASGDQDAVRIRRRISLLRRKRIRPRVRTRIRIPGRGSEKRPAARSRRTCR